MSPDQIAWELNLNEMIQSGEISYDRFIHYPHEGGTILVSLLSLIFKPIFPFKSIVVSAFVLDFFSRLIQLSVVSKIAGKRAMIFYGIFTLFSLPLLVPWASIIYGLHAISAVFPFVFLFLLYRSHNGKYSFLLDGVFMGLSIWFIYTNVLFVPIYILYLVWKKASLKSWLSVFIPLLIILLFHVLIRNFFDPGFHLSAFDSSSIRGEEFDLTNWSIYSRSILVWKDVFYQVSIIDEFLNISAHSLRIMWFCISIIGVAVLAYHKENKTKYVFGFGCLTVLAFTTIYALSPFYLESPDWANYVNSRHFSYIFPVFMALAIIGLSSLKLTSLLLIPLFAISASSFYTNYKKQSSDAVLIRPAGWVLATKFGHNSDRMTHLLENQPYDKNELLIGYGWGMAMNLFAFQKLDNGIENEIDESIITMIDLINDHPIENQLKLI